MVSATFLGYEAQALPVLQGAHPAQKINMHAANRKDIGCAVALSQYAALGIERVLYNRMRSRRVEYDLNAVSRLSCASA